LIFWNSSGTDNRLDNSVPITLRNGQLSADAYQSSGVNQWGSSETVGTVTLDYGHSTIRAGGGRPRVALTITNLARNAGSTVYFYRAGNSSKTADFYGYGQVKLTAWQPGFMGGWAVARRTDYNPSGTLYESGYDFGYYSNSTAILSGVLPMENQEPRPGQVAGASASDHVKVLAAQTTLSGNTAINSLCVTNNGCNNDLGGFQLNIASGGLLNSATSYAITNGTLTSSGGNLYLYNLGTAMTNGAAITGGGVSVSTVGNMLLAGNNSFGGNLYVNAGILTLSGVNGGVSEAIVTPGSFLILQNAGALSAMTKVNLLYDGEEYARVTNSFANVRIKGLTLNGVKQPFGTYGATGSGCRYTNDFYFGGTGTWSVVAPSGTMVLFR
jgi:autotransporter-associated beta strand protein